MEYFALGTVILASIVIPLIGIIILLVKEKNSRIKQLGYLLCGAVIYLLMQWGIKEKGLQWLYNNKRITGIDMNAFSTNHYMLNLFLVALVGSVFLYGVSDIFFRFIRKRKYSARNILFFGFGYCMTEAVMLAGIRSIYTIIYMIKGEEGDLSTGVTELFLSAYERLLIFVVELALLMVLAYFVQKKHSFLGTAVTGFCGTLLGFLPAFFIAFSTTQFLEIYSRTTALIIVYVFLTAAAVTACIVLWSICPLLGKDCIEKKTQNKKENRKE